MIYLASPYTHDDETVRFRRYIAAREFSREQMRQGIQLFSPIVYGHHYVSDFEEAISFVFWQPFNEHMLRASQELWVLMLKNWQESVGVAAEIALATKLSLPIAYKEPLPHASF